MIHKLTEEQEKQLEVYKNKWLNIGLNTDRIELKEAIKIWNDFNDSIYKLYKMTDKVNIKANYLMMQNPSIDTKHFESVPVECDTIEKALAWRNYQWEIGTDFKGYEKPIVLT